jgi:hypothetical protein
MKINILLAALPLIAAPAVTALATGRGQEQHGQSEV